ncbi:hypothetical protein BH09BAC1_BH09BAC1_24360 [soil metagenome]
MITQLITELETIAQAQVGLNGLVYGEPFEINNQRNKDYPLLFIDRNVRIEGMNLKTRQRVYNLKLSFFDRYPRPEEIATPSENKQRDLEILAEQFLQEFKERYKAQGNHWKIENEEKLLGNWQYRKHQDRLIELNYKLQIRCQGTCLAGTFNYPTL